MGYEAKFGGFEQTKQSYTLSMLVLLNKGFAIVAQITAKKNNNNKPNNDDRLWFLQLLFAGNSAHGKQYVLTQWKNVPKRFTQKTKTIKYEKGSCVKEVP